MWITDVVPHDDGSVTIRVLTYWDTDLPAMIKLLFWSAL
jgi:hypothetical protein